MALTDADRLQMTLLAVMRHNVVTIIDKSGGGGYYGELSALYLDEYTLVNITSEVYPEDVSALLPLTQTVVVIDASWTFDDYLLL